MITPPADSATAESAMTEIALALAMGFFSLMVLTLISMGAGQPQAPEKKAADRSSRAVVLAETADSEPITGTVETGDGDFFVIFHGQRLLNEALEPLETGAIVRLAGDRRVVLAIDPKIPLDQALKARASIGAPNLVVAPLDQAWLDRLAQLRKMEAQP
ncbi:MAG: hypothetical protein ACPGOV_06580 [Magnetovibrionaceae bacterium]